MINFGKISTIFLIGGGELMKYFANIAKNKNIKIISIMGPRHAKEIINGEKIEDYLKKYGTVVKLNKFDKTKIKKLVGNKKDFLFISFDSPWIFDDDTIKNLFKNRLINSHSTRLPQNRGGGGFSWRILNQEKFGVCLIHLISSSKIDKGEILFHKNFLFPYALKKPIEYHSFQIDQEKKFLLEFLNKLINKNNFKPLGQPEYLSSYFPRLYTDSNGWIDWSLINIDLFNFICAFDDPYDGAITNYNNKKVRIKSVTWTRSEQIFHPYQFGMIYRKTNNWIVVAINSGSLIIEEVLNQSGENIIKKIKIGDRFNSPQKNLEGSKVRKYFNSLGIK